MASSSVDLVALERRLEAAESQLRAVGSLATTTAKGLGKDRSQRQLLAFCSQGLRQQVLELKDKWDRGAQTARTQGVSVAERPPPLKYQMFEQIIGALEAQGLSGEPLAEIKSIECTAIEALFVNVPANGQVAILTFLFRPTHEGLQALDLFSRPAVREAIRKRDGQWPACGLRSGRYLPSREVRSVLEGLGHSDESIRDYWSKGKGRGNSPVGGGKRRNDQRPSLLASQDGRQTKR